MAIHRDHIVSDENIAWVLLTSSLNAQINVHHSGLNDQDRLDLCAVEPAIMTKALKRDGPGHDDSTIHI